MRVCSLDCNTSCMNHYEVLFESYFGVSLCVRPERRPQMGPFFDLFRRVADLARRKLEILFYVVFH